MPITPAIEPLLALHRVDRDIDKLRSQKKLLPVSLRRIEARLAQQQQTLNQRKERIARLRLETRGKGGLLRAAEEELEALTVKLNAASTNKEYAALQHEITAKRVDSSRIEDQILAAMADVDALQAEIHRIEQNIASIQHEHDQEAPQVGKQAVQIDRQIAQLQAQRQAVASAVDDVVLREYQRIAAKKGSSALAPVIANTCQGCFMQLPPQLGHTLAAGREIVHCPSCNRILYIP